VEVTGTGTSGPGVPGLYPGGDPGGGSLYPRPREVFPFYPEKVNPRFPGAGGTGYLYPRGTPGLGFPGGFSPVPGPGGPGFPVKPEPGSPGSPGKTGGKKGGVKPGGNPPVPPVYPGPPGEPVRSPFPR